MAKNFSKSIAHRLALILRLLIKNQIQPNTFTTMSIATSNSTQQVSHRNSPSVKSFKEWEASISWVETTVSELQQTTSPVWPLSDYVAVHPYLGWLDYKFENAHAELQKVSDCQLLPAIEVFADQFAGGYFGRQHVLEAAEEILEFPAKAPEFTHRLVSDLLAKAEQPHDVKASLDADDEPYNRLKPMAELSDLLLGTSWSENIHHEVGRFCASYYDEGQANWGNPFKGEDLYEAWKLQASVSRNIEVLGLTGFRKLVSKLPENPAAAIVYCLSELEVPERLWKGYLLSHLLALPGWFAWARYKSETSQEENTGDFAALLAICLVYDFAVVQALHLPIDWNAFKVQLDEAAENQQIKDASNELVQRSVCLRAGELAFAERVLNGLDLSAVDSNKTQQDARKSAQLVFCIDVRSERIRRHFEAVNGTVETFGFAGFFGVPMAFRGLGEESCSSRLPVLLNPKFQVQEGFHGECSTAEQIRVAKRAVRWSRKLLKQFQSAAFSCFSYVESLGLLYAWNLTKKTVRFAPSESYEFDGLRSDQRSSIGPTLEGLNEQGIGHEQQVQMAESILKNLGLTSNFARLIVFCGHTSKTTNNPLAASLDCGACGGHGGESNARFAAMLLNQPGIRSDLSKRGIVIPEDTHFLAGVHNTTTDSVDFFDLQFVPESHVLDLRSLQETAKEAGERTRCERSKTFENTSSSGLVARSVDWSEVRPEWGLAGNAAFIVAPRQMTQNANFDGRTFLHSYDHTKDADLSVLELIMTAPMVVAHWINMQYFASSVDPKHFSSGSKTIHNVAGQFGIVAGNGGDLQIGLPNESFHNGNRLQHQPLRLMAVIAAPRQAISQVISKHYLLQQIFEHEWMHLVAIEDGVQFKLTDDLEWVKA